MRGVGKSRSLIAAAFAVLAALVPDMAGASKLTAIISMKAEHAQHEHWEEWNPGLSFEQRFLTSEPLDASFSAGSVRDSIGNWSPHAAFGVHRRIGDWSLGLRATVFYRHENLDGEPIGLRFAPLPSLEYVGDGLGIGLVFLPPPTDDADDSSAVLMQLRLQL